MNAEFIALIWYLFIQYPLLWFTGVRLDTLVSSLFVLASRSICTFANTHQVLAIS